MRARRTTVTLLLALVVGGCTDDEEPGPIDLTLPDPGLPPVALPRRIAFGSCSDPTQPMPLLDVATSLEPELYLWLGDNVYADTSDEDVMRQTYLALASSAEFGRLRDEAHLLATWDDHDYGEDDAGEDFVGKEMSREVFLEFWQEPADSPRRDREGIYEAYRYEQDGHQLQIILLDTRYNREALTPNDGSGKNDYLPNPEPRSILGQAQWTWLQERLREPAELRLVASSIQLAHDYNGYESWTLFPSERQRFVDLVQSTQAEGVLLLSGDVHWAEVSRLQVAEGYDLFDVTSSGINQDWPFVEDNAARVGQAVPEHNVGLLTIDWDAQRITARIYDATATARLELSLDFAQLRF